MKKRKIKLSSYDKLLLFALTVAILLVYVRYRTLADSPLSNNGEQAAISYSLQASSRTRADRIALAETVSFSDIKDLFGRIEKAPEINPAYKEALRADGTVAYLPSNSIYELRGIFYCEGSFTENGFFANGRYHMTANQTFSVTMNGLNVTILVLNVARFSSK